MMNDAQSHESDRRKRAKVDDARAAADAAEMRAAATAASGDGDEAPSFVRDVAKSVYAGESAGGASLADRVNQQRHYAQRGSGADSFMRR